MRVHACVVLVFVLFLVSVPSLLAQEELPNPQAAVPAELIAGTLGGAALGLAGTYIASTACLSHVQGWAAFGCIAYAALGYLVGVPLGSVVGVHVAAAHYHVQGNLLLSILGGIGGEAAGLGCAALATKIFGDMTEPFGTLMFLGVIPFSSSVGAAWGYNAGARSVARLELAVWRRSYQLIP